LNASASTRISRAPWTATSPVMSPTARRRVAVARARTGPTIHLTARSRARSPAREKRAATTPMVATARRRLANAGARSCSATTIPKGAPPTVRAAIPRRRSPGSRGFRVGTATKVEWKPWVRTASGRPWHRAQSGANRGSERATGFPRGPNRATRVPRSRASRPISSSSTRRPTSTTPVILASDGRRTGAIPTSRVRPPVRSTEPRVMPLSPSRTKASTSGSALGGGSNPLTGFAASSMRALSQPWGSTSSIQSRSHRTFHGSRS